MSRQHAPGGNLLAQVAFPKSMWLLSPILGNTFSWLVRSVTDRALSIQDLRLPQALCVTYEGPKVSVLLPTSLMD